jgi:hypothetical protein
MGEMICKLPSDNINEIIIIYVNKTDLLLFSGLYILKHSLPIPSTDGMKFTVCHWWTLQVKHCCNWYM